MGCRQALQHGPHGRRQAVVDLVARRPQRVASGGRQRVNLEHGVVGGHRLKRDVCVPSCRCEPRDVAELVGQAAAFLLLLGADDGDLVAQLAALFCQGVDMEAGRFGLVACNIYVYK